MCTRASFLVSMMKSNTAIALGGIVHTTPGGRMEQPPIPDKMQQFEDKQILCGNHYH